MKQLGPLTLIAFLAAGCMGGSDASSGETGGEGGDRGDDESTIARCTTSCESGKSCQGSDPTLDCPTFCTELEGIVVAGGCRTEYNLLLACEGRIPDICSEGVDCEPEVSAYDECIFVYCDAHDDECARVFQRS